MTPRGGHREGAGRPSLPPEQRMKLYTVRLTQAEAELARKLGDGSLTEGVRKALGMVAEAEPKSE